MLSDAVIAQLVQRGYQHSTGEAWEDEYFVTDVLAGGVNYQVVVVCGSNSARDWLRNFLIYPKRDSKLGGRVHHGYAISTKRLVDNHFLRFARGVGSLAYDGVLQLYFSPLLDATRPVIVAGHSKGGGQAQLLAVRLKLAGFHVERLVVLASPPIWFGDDWPGLPFPAVSYCFGDDRVCDPPIGRRVLSHRIPLTRIGETTGDRDDDHAMSHYLKALRVMGA